MASLWVLMESHQELEEFKDWRVWRKRNIWSNKPFPVKMNTAVKTDRLAHEPSGNEPTTWEEPANLKPLVLLPVPGLKRVAQPKKGCVKHGPVSAGEDKSAPWD